MNYSQQMTLKALRVNAGLSRKEVAEKLEVSIYTWENYENYNSFPNVQMVKKIMKLFNVGFNDIKFLK